MLTPSDRRTSPQYLTTTPPPPALPRLFHSGKRGTVVLATTTMRYRVTWEICHIPEWTVNLTTRLVCMFVGLSVYSHHSHRARMDSEPNQSVRSTVGYFLPYYYISYYYLMVYLDLYALNK